MAKIKLKPCPFCGGEDVYIPHLFGISTGTIKCPDCGITIEVDYDSHYVSDYDIAMAWNTRADN